MITSKHDIAHWRREVAAVDAAYEKGAFHWPVHYILSLTHECNLHCPFCFLRKVEGEEAMTRDDWLHVLRQIPDDSRVILFGGEPMLAECFEDVYRTAAARLRCSIVTNGTLLDSKSVDVLLAYDGLVDLNVSVDSIGNWNRNFTSSDWDRLVEGLRIFNKKRKRMSSPPNLGISVVILDETAEELFDLHRLAHEQLECTFVNYCFLNGTSMQLSDVMHPFADLYAPESPPLYEKWDVIESQLTRVRAYDKENGYASYLRPKLIDMNGSAPTENLRPINNPMFNKERYGPCKMPWADCRIHPDGNVSACLSVCFGNFKQTPDLKSILSSSVAQRFRNELKTNGLYPQCARCVFLYDKAFDRTAMSVDEDTNG